MKKPIGRALAPVFTLTLAACRAKDTQKRTIPHTWLQTQPGVECVPDDEGDVGSVMPLNEDGEGVTSDLDLEGKPSDEALEKDQSEIMGNLFDDHRASDGRVR